MIFAYPAMGGVLAIYASLFFGAVMLYALVMAYVSIRVRNVMAHRAWMIRSYAMGLSVATTRLVGIIGSELTGIEFDEFFGAFVTIGFLLNWLVAEIIKGLS